jgi:galactokinase
METIAVIDFETTGLTPEQGARATEIAVALVRDGCEAGVVEQVTRQYVVATGLPGEGFVCASAPGACECRVQNAEG